eukprot:TRINITY_DN50817_c0_g1_i1.p1 TRINITY_DN50817_c0_g1~~TRINITY_DN50817_c0_g1_i1.p1  ORF type:complete len:376 (-),score=62.35 TRINITY_DN50817_c0_g1_i1:62-1138(-)
MASAACAADSDDATSCDGTVLGSEASEHPNIAAATASAGASRRCDRSRLVWQLTNFLKEYYISGEELAIREMLQDVAADGRYPQDVAPWGSIPARVVREALVQFDTWKQGGRIGMPGTYTSTTKGQEIACLIDSIDAKGAVELVDAARTKRFKRHADPKQVKPRKETGWYVPPLPDDAGFPAEPLRSRPRPVAPSSLTSSPAAAFPETAAATAKLSAPAPPPRVNAGASSSAASMEGMSTPSEPRPAQTWLDKAATHTEPAVQTVEETPTSSPVDAFVTTTTAPVARPSFATSSSGRTWRRYRIPEPGEGFWWCCDDAEDAYFLEPTPGLWELFLDPTSSRSYWWHSETEEYFFQYDV